MQQLNRYIRNWYQDSPLSVIILAGFIIRFFAVIFSKGFGMHDDHFLVIEAGASFADGSDYNRWLPWHRPGLPPSAHSWFYVGIHYLLFNFFNFLGLSDPQGKMYIIRFLHAVYSLLIIFFSYKIADRLSGKEAASRTGWLLAILWFLPGMCVRNLVEMVCIPPLLAASWLMIRYEDERKINLLWLSGFCLGLGMGIRFQSMFFVWGVGLYWLVKKEWKALFITSLAAFISFFITQSADLILWKRPFAEITAYIDYNIIHKTDYFNRPWYQYFLTVGGLLLPPVSLYLMYAYFRNWKKYLILFLPSFLFFAVHSWFPNKQERFILPFIPFLIIAGVCGWMEIRKNIKWKKFEKGSWKFFWIVNAIPLVVVSTMYTKKSLVDGMYYLYHQKDFHNFVIDVSHRDSPQWPPQYYSGQWNMGFCLYQGWGMDSLQVNLKKIETSEQPDYVLFFQDTDLKNRVHNFESGTGTHLELRYIAEPSWMDKLLHWLNPRNKNEPMYIYHVEGKLFDH